MAESLEISDNRDVRRTLKKLILGYIGVKIANFPEDIVLDYIEPNKLLMK